MSAEPFSPAESARRDQEIARQDAGDWSRSLAEQLAVPPRPLAWDVAGILPSLGILGILGRPKSLKTFFAWQLGLCRAAGVPFLEHATADPVRVLYLDEESGESLLFDRFLHNRAGHPAFTTPETLERFRIASFQSYRFLKDRLRAQLEAVRPGLVIFDSYRRFLPSELSENDSGDTATAFAWVSDLRRDFETAVAIVHHTRKAVGDGESWEDSARGSGDFFAAVDGLVGLTKRPHGLLSLRGTFRAAGEIEPVTLAFNPETFLLEPTSAKPAAGFDAPAEIEAFLRSQLTGDALQTAAQAHLEKLGRNKKQAERDLAKVPTFDRRSPPPGLKLGKESVPGTNGGQKRIFLVETRTEAALRRVDEDLQAGH
jgi:hypothetical protein